MMIARVWRGETRRAAADAYVEYLVRTGVQACRETPGNQGVYVLRRLAPAGAEFVFVSLWDSFEGIRRFAGNEPEKAVFYPEDERFLIRREDAVSHYEVAVPSTAPGPSESAAPKSFAGFLLRHE
jgi:heme-degrading monooxygenase HmoA